VIDEIRRQFAMWKLFFIVCIKLITVVSPGNYS
jgi:hypothetical protein